jgi:hypothetical protein
VVRIPAARRSPRPRRPSGDRPRHHPASPAEAVRYLAHEIEGAVGPDSEFVELAWVTLTAARKLALPTITLSILEELEDRLANGFTPELPVPFYYEHRGRFVREVL